MECNTSTTCIVTTLSEKLSGKYVPRVQLSRKLKGNGLRVTERRKYSWGMSWPAGGGGDPFRSKTGLKAREETLELNYFEKRVKLFASGILKS